MVDAVVHVTDDEFIALLDAEDRAFLLELDAPRRAHALRILRKQHAATERARREAEALAQLPDHAWWCHHALVEAEQMLRRGATVEQIEHALFDGIPSDAATVTVMRAGHALGVKRRAGTHASLNAISKGFALARHRSPETAARFRAERHQFGETRATRFMAEAGLDPDDWETSDDS
jgi:hypothetical protein